MSSEERDLEPWRKKPSVRIDVLTRRLEGSVALLQLVSEHITDLHDLAYNRPRATAEKVHGGSRDYALDSHGDMRARDLYQSIASDLVDLIETVATSSHDALKYLRAGGLPATRRDRTADATADEVLLALAAKRRREQQGTPSPKTTAPQTVPRAPDHLAELENLRGALHKVLVATSGMTRMKEGTRYAPARREVPLNLTRIATQAGLTPREAEAWNRATKTPEVRAS